MMLAAIGAGAVLSGPAAAQKAGPKIIVGWIENVLLSPGNLEVRAKLDTGARTSSLNAPRYELFRRNGEEWVAFDVTNRAGKSVHFERRVVRRARIKRIKGPSQMRPVVMLGLCVGDVFRETQVNLVNRDGFNYQMLIGRRYMARHVIVDPGRTFAVQPVCTESAKAANGNDGKASADRRSSRPRSDGAAGQADR